MPATFTVTSNLDNGLGGTLRDAIIQANMTPGVDTINFAIGLGSLPQTITLDATRGALPSIIEAVNIDGASQGGPLNFLPAIEINGNNINGPGLMLSTGGSTISGLSITRFGAAGIAILNPVGSAGNTVFNCYIGTDLSGTASGVGNLVGVAIAGSNNTIGDVTGTLKTVISGNSSDGVRIVGAAVAQNVVCSSYIGVNLTGLAKLANGGHGVILSNGATNNTIGSPGATDRGNVISGNGGNGVELMGSSNNKLIDNYIGLGAAGLTALGNTGNGVRAISGSKNTEFLGFNVIAGNGSNGILLTGDTVAANDVTGTKIYGAHIGTTKDGDAARANGGWGVKIDNASGNFVGGNAAGQNNVISGNTGGGVSILGSNGRLNVVANNFIGLNAGGTAKVANKGEGVYITGSSNTIGQSGLTGRNVISGNEGHGVRISGGSFNTVANCYIGTTAAGTKGDIAVGNDKDGVFIELGSDNTIGGLLDTLRNVISGNAWDGIDIRGSGDGTNATRNTIAGNYIGLEADGITALGNGNNGVHMERCVGNTVGGANEAAWNYICGNGEYGVDLNIGTSGNLVRNNNIGKNAKMPTPDTVKNNSGWQNDVTGGLNTWQDNLHD